MVSLAHGGLERINAFMDIPRSGYYGTRGVAIITHAVMEKFALELREAERTDPVIIARGGVSFVQHVIVPEIILDLVMEDMGVDGGRALEIMGESAQIGFQTATASVI